MKFNMSITVYIQVEVKDNYIYLPLEVMEFQPKKIVIGENVVYINDYKTTKDQAMIKNSIIENGNYTAKMFK